MDFRSTVGLVTCPIMIGFNVAMLVLAGSIQGAGGRWTVRGAAVIFALWSLLQITQTGITWDETSMAFVLQGTITFVLALVGGSKSTKV
jgi:hypothetical protein